MSLFRHWSLSDFDCKCCGKNWTKIEWIQELDHVQDVHPHKITIISGFRCFDYNRNVGGAPKSQHLFGTAADLTSDDIEGLYQLCMKMFDAVGDGRSKGFVHVDRRRDRKRHWTY